MRPQPLQRSRFKNPRDFANEARKADIKDMEGLGRWALHMSDEDELALYMRFPQLDPKHYDETNMDLCDREWLKWIKSSASEPYRVRDKI